MADLPKVPPLILWVPLSLVQWTPLIPKGVEPAEAIAQIAFMYRNNPKSVPAIPVRQIFEPIPRSKQRAQNQQLVGYEAFGNQAAFDAAHAAKVDKVKVEIQSLTDKEIVAQYQPQLRSEPRKRGNQ